MVKKGGCSLGAVIGGAWLKAMWPVADLVTGDRFQKRLIERRQRMVRGPLDTVKVASC
jgi:hypothetical protein